MATTKPAARMRLCNDPCPGVLGLNCDLAPGHEGQHGYHGNPSSPITWGEAALTAPHCNSIARRRSNPTMPTTYRQVDYWLRLGIVRLASNPICGSGRRRQWTEHEREALRRFVERKTEIEQELAAMLDRSGSYFAALVNEVEAEAH